MSSPLTVAEGENLVFGAPSSAELSSRAQPSRSSFALALFPRSVRAFYKVGFVLGSILLAAVCALALSILLTMVSNGRAVTQTIHVDNALDKLSFLLTEAETNERGYVVTGSSTYLKKYQSTIGDKGLKAQFDILRNLTLGDEEQQDQLSNLEPLVKARITEMQNAIEAKRRGGTNAARTVVMSNLARGTAGRIGSLIDAMNGNVNQRLVSQTDDRDEGAFRSMLDVGAGGLLAISLLSLSGIQLQHEIVKRRKSEEDVRRLNAELEERVQQRTEHLEEAKQQISTYAHDLEATNVEMLERLARAGEYRDDDTGQHTQRVAFTASLLARGLGLSDEESRQIQQASRLHDVGKIGIPDTILLKPGSLTSEEFATMKTHTIIGAALFADGHSDLIQVAQHIALTHHERWDGRGYPNGLQDEEIPLAGRIVAVADVFDALTHERPYKQAWPIEKAVSEIRACSGAQFDPQVVEVFLSLTHADLL